MLLNLTYTNTNGNNIKKSMNNKIFTIESPTANSYHPSLMLPHFFLIIYNMLLTLQFTHKNSLSQTAIFTYIYLYNNKLNIKLWN